MIEAIVSIDARLLNVESKIEENKIIEAQCKPFVDQMKNDGATHFNIYFLQLVGVTDDKGVEYTAAEYIIEGT